MLILGILIGGTVGTITMAVLAAHGQRGRFEFIDLVDAVEKAKDGRNARPDHLDRAFVEGADAVLGQLLMRDDTGEEEMRLAYSASGRDQSMDPEAAVEERGEV